ncbi:response regulator [Gynuella sp.]|uniref:response regulator n=1 Tax=Gynuella sp. TaxID=2969146 RepID=UPI003D0CD801
MSSLNLVVADDHPLFRKALTEALRESDYQVNIIETECLGTTKEILDKQKGDIDVLFLDLQMPGSEGIMGLIEIKTAYPELAIVVVTANKSSKIMQQIKAAGALGYLPKSLTLTEMVGEVNKLFKGHPCFPADIEEEQPNETDIDAVKKIASLTPQQQKVLTLISKGFLNKQIAYELDVKETTIKTHVSEIFRKLGIYNRTQAAVYRQYMEHDDS